VQEPSCTHTGLGAPAWLSTSHISDRYRVDSLGPLPITGHGSEEPLYLCGLFGFLGDRAVRACPPVHPSTHQSGGGGGGGGPRAPGGAGQGVLESLGKEVSFLGGILDNPQPHKAPNVKLPRSSHLVPHLLPTPNPCHLPV
jgi:hypothetical protein